MHWVIVLELYTKPVYKLFHVRIRLNIQSNSLRWELLASLTLTASVIHQRPTTGMQSVARINTH